MRWHTSLGDVTLRESVWRWSGGSGLRPFSARAGVRGNGCSRRLQRLAADFGLEESFARASERLEEHHGAKLPSSSLRRVTLAHAGRIARKQLARESPRSFGTGGEPLILAQADGTMIPTVEFVSGSGDRRKRRSIQWRETRLLAARPLGSVRTSYAVSGGGVEEAGEQWMQAALLAGWGFRSRILAMGDGAAWIALQAGLRFRSQATFLLDLFHVLEYLSAAADPRRPDYRDWAKSLLLAGRSGELIEELAGRAEPDEIPEESAPVRAAHRYLANRLDHLDYPYAKANGFPTGTGLIEAGHKHILQKRLKISGAAWSRDNADSVAHARAMRANGRWNQYWNSFDPTRN